MNVGEVLSVNEERQGEEGSLNIEGSAEAGDERGEEVIRAGEDAEWRDGEGESQKAAALEDAEQEKEDTKSQDENVEAGWTSEICSQSLESKTIPETQKEVCVQSSTTHNSVDTNKQGHTPSSEDAATNPDVQSSDDNACAINTQVTNLSPDTHLPSTPSEENIQTTQSDRVHFYYLVV